jgi:hypothetical protein
MSCLPGMGGFFSDETYLSRLALVDDESGSDTSSIVVPTDVKAGDLLLFANMAIKTSVVTPTVPSGFTKVLPVTQGGVAYGPVNISGTNYYFHYAIGYKIAVGDEGGTSLSSMSFTSAVNPGSALAVAVLRGNRKVTGVTRKDDFLEGDVDGEVSEIITSGSGAVPLLAVGLYANLAVSWSSENQRQMSPSADDETIFGASNHALRWKFFAQNSTPSNVTCTMASAAQRRVLGTLYLELEAA